ncbi:rhamnulokinase family protein [Sinomonas sp. ASV486]|uniref:rhamnulokinase n=1 Tax=Sinomonas sp. ASV486 TaxID=3051170 RepID=UPI0027DC4006|nr:rhamnulokinase family protein [Sinomonas sp. ASV486]MDQ4492060.1 rhamnulokinase family protein [Sinomonas sp. ASV486]
MNEPGAPGPGRHCFAAVDVGASSGRVILATVGAPQPAGGGPGGMHDGGGPGGMHDGAPHDGAAKVALDVVHRFPNGVIDDGVTGDGARVLRWDLPGIFAEVQTGLTKAREAAAARGLRIESIGIDTWAVDYGLVDGAGRLKEPVFSYRDGRTEAAIPVVHAKAAPERLYGVNGLQFLPFTTLYQLAAEPRLDGYEALLIPDLLAFWLTGARRTEETNASTTGLLDARTGNWSQELFEALGFPEALFPELIAPGETYGTLLPAVAERTGLPAGTPVVAVGSHDTASAVAAVPAAPRGDSEGEEVAYISSGTWSLVGVELDAPVLTDASRAANFTNERGVDGTIRYLRNVGGLWLLSESQRQWAAEGRESSLEVLLAAAAALPAGGPQIDVDSEEFIAPGGMPERIHAAAARAGASGGSHPSGGDVLADEPGAVVRCILDSLAAAYARTIAQAALLSGRRPQVVHVVGGGSQNELLCRLTADATGLPVIAGPVEATALGNVLVQARAAGALDGGLAALRAAVRASVELREYVPAAV